MNCGDECKECASATACAECVAPSKLYEGSCVMECPAHTFINSTVVDHYEADLKCLPCDSTCKTCSGSEPNRCSSCDQTDLKHSTFLEGQCVDFCPRGYIEKANTCFLCGGDHCQACSNPDNLAECDQCDFGYYLVNGSCVADCPPT